MGIHGLTKSIKEMSSNGIIEKTYEELAKYHTILGVDVFSYLYPSQYNTRAKGKGSHIRTFLDMISNFHAVNIRLVFVFDGKTYNEDKKDTIDTRMKKRNDIQMDLLQILNKISTEVLVDKTVSESIDANMLKVMGEQMINEGRGTEEDRIALCKIMKCLIVITPQDIKDLMTLFDFINIPHFRAKGEADFLLATMYEDKLISGVLSEDKDMLTHGVGHLISGLIDSNCRREGTVIEYNLDTILQESKLNMAQFIDFCILSGCDYGAKIEGIAAGKGLQYIKKYGNINGIINAMNSNLIPFRPDKQLSIEEYQIKYNRVYSIFYERQESIDESFNKDFTYGVHPDLKPWLLTTTNYTNYTLCNKILQLSSKPQIPDLKQVHVIIKPKFKPKLLSEIFGHIKEETVDTVSQTKSSSKIKIYIKQKHYT